MNKYMSKINANGVEIRITGDGDDYISLTDIARYKSDDPNAILQNWMRNKDVIEFLGEKKRQDQIHLPYLLKNG